MRVFIVTTSLKNDPYDIDSVWSSEEKANERIVHIMQDEYFERYGSIKTIQFDVDELQKVRHSTLTISDSCTE